MKYTALITALVLMPVNAYAGMGDKNSVPPNSGPSRTEKGLEGLNIPDDFNMKSVQDVWNSEEKRNSAVKRYSYSPKRTYPVQLRQNMHSLIVLPSWETAEVVTLGDSSLFSFQKFDKRFNRENMIVVQGVVPGADTDMRVIGKSGNVYNFYLRNDPVDSQNIPTLTVYVEKSRSPTFQQENMQNDDGNNNSDKKTSIIDNIKPVKMSELKDLQKSKADYLETLPQGKKYNLDYKIAGDMEIAPRGVFSDGEFTYFDYRGRLPSQRLPVVYKIVNDKVKTQKSHTQ